MAFMAYILQRPSEASRTFCPQCGNSVALLCPRGITLPDTMPFFFICFHCSIVKMAGGEVIEGDDPRANRLDDG